MKAKQEFNNSFALNGVDVRYSEYQLAILASMVTDEPIQNILHKNKVYNLYKKYSKDVITARMMNIKVNVLFDEILKEDKTVVSKAFGFMSESEEEITSTYVKKYPGVVAIQSYDYGIE